MKVRFYIVVFGVLLLLMSFSSTFAEAEYFAIAPSQTTPTFNDVPADHWAFQWIEALYASGITSGCGGGNYCPDANVTRAQMAIFLERGMRGTGFTPPAATGMFADVPVDHWAAGWIEQLAADGITAGCGGGNYCPDANVTRAQMAIFIERAMHWPGAFTPPPASGTVFNDVPIDHWAAAWIEQLASDGITGGCTANPPLYCPDNPVTRAQMAVFLVRAFNLPIGPTPTPTNTPTSTPTSTPTPTNTPTPTATFTPTPTPEADLWVTKSDSPDPVQAGWDLTYVIEVSNDGPDDATGVVVTDNPPADVTYQSHVASQGVFNPGPPAEWNVGDLSVGSSATLTIVVQVSASAPSGTITNEATVTSDVFDPDGTDNTAEADTLVISTNQVQSDDFNCCPTPDSSIWTSVDPVGDSTIRTDGTNARIAVPAGTAHSPWDGAEIKAPRLMQDINNENFEVDVKFETQPSGTTATQGFLVQQDADDFIRFDFYSSGSDLYLYAGSITAGVANPPFINKTLALSAPLYMRVTRAGDDWTLSTSGDGSTWTAETPFTQAITAAKVGVFVGNSGASPPAYDGAIDYFFNTLTPIDPEDPIHKSFIFSDDFSGGSLDTDVWTFIDPLDDIADPTLTGTNVEIMIPAGFPEHEFWTGTENTAPRLMQDVCDRNFEIDVKFDSEPFGTYTAQGVVIEEGPNDFLQYYIYSYQNPDPPYENHLIIYAAKVVAGGPEEVIPGTDIEIFVTAPMYIRVARNGTWWTLSYSDDGTTWNALPSFEYAITATKVGIAIGAEVPDMDPPPGFTGSIDYFQNNDVPIDPHD